jgi:hypothetical protein
MWFQRSSVNRTGTPLRELIISTSVPAAGRSRLAGPTAGRLRGGLVAGNRRLAEYVRGRLSAAFGPVKVGIEADQGQVVLLRRDVLVSVVEVQMMLRADIAC